MLGNYRSVLLGLAVALALADSSVVTLALPDILSDFDVSVGEVAWVLISFNLVLAATAVPAAQLVRGHPQMLFAVGLLVFGAASLVCGLASNFGILVAGRCVQAVGAALVVATVLVLLAAVEESERRAAHVWVSAGVLGAAFGPAIGGVITQLGGWDAIFLIQAPVAFVPLLALRRLPVRRPPSATADSGRPHVGVNLALLLGSAALSAALFLLVVLLVNGWSIDPAKAGLIVTLMPLSAIAAGRLSFLAVGRVVRAATGFVLMAGGLAALGLLPHVGWGWTVAPQLLVGTGLGLTIAVLTEQALAGQANQAAHGGWTIASRHAGIVLGLLVLTPVFTHELASNQEGATRAGAAIVLDSSIEPLHKIRVAQDVLRTIDNADGRLPDVRPAFETEGSDGDANELRRVGDALQQQLERAVTSAFGPPFLLAALFALGALAVVAVTRDTEP